MQNNKIIIIAIIRRLKITNIIKHGTNIKTVKHDNNKHMKHQQLRTPST